MKPNKQKILSSQPQMPGLSTKQSLSKPSLSIKFQSNSIPKYPQAKQQEFHLSEIVKNLKIKKKDSPFKMISFEDSKTDSLLIEKHSNSYKFVSALSPSDDLSSTEKESKDTSIPIRRSLSEVIKDDEACNNTTDTYKHKHDSVDYYGILPATYWCKRCKNEVVSNVTMNLPTLSV